MRYAAIALAVGAAAAASLAFANPGPSPLGPAPASGAGLADDQCLLTTDIRNHSVVDKNTLLLDAGGRSRGVYRFTMRNGCLNSAVSSDPLGINQAGRAKVCKPKDLGLTARSGLCHIDSIVKLTPEEVAALPRKLKP